MHALKGDTMTNSSHGSDLCPGSQHSPLPYSPQALTASWDSVGGARLKIAIKVIGSYSSTESFRSVLVKSC